MLNKTARGFSAARRFITPLSTLKAIRDKQSINTPPLRASLGSEDSPQDDRFIHTLVPITDETGTTVHRLFIYSEKTV